MIAVSVKPCIVMCILPDAGAISTSAEFLLVYDIIEFAGRILNVPQCYIRATNFHKDNLWVLLLLRSQNLSYWNLNLFLDYFVIFDSGLGHSAILKQTLILGIRN